MRQPCFAGIILAFLVMSLAGGHRLAAQSDQPPPVPSSEDLNAPPPTPAQEQPEVLTRGPVHEAFAEPINLQVQAGVVAPSQPPAIIEEIPPAERPQGDRFVWVPGYWSWDGDRRSYIWVSACWRIAPPNMYWVPGYWSQVTGGWEWVAGFWTPAGAQEIEYLPAPPASEDVQPSGPPPSPDKTWVPPCWYWYQGQYVQRPGYWLAAQPNWVWVPSHYVWTPRGYVFCEGHWDYPLETRGVLFAPVYFPPSVYARAGYSYSPSIVVDLGVLTANLFTYPRYSHYYFGDYYDASYVSAGIYPRFEGDRFHTWYDPIYEYDRSRYRRTDSRWEEQQRREYDLRRDDKQLRPARTYREQETRLAKLPESQRRTLQVAQLLTTAVARKTIPVKFEQINADARQKIAKQAIDVHSFRQERTRWEATPAVPKASQLPTEHKDLVKPADHKELVTPPVEQKGPVTPPEHKEAVTPLPAEHKPVTPPTEHKEVMTPPAEHKPVTPPTDRKELVTPPVEHKPATPAAEQKAAFAPARDVHLTQPERIKIPAPPIVGKQGTPDVVEKGPPARPVDEQRHKAEVKSEVKDTHKDEGEHKSN